MNTAKPRVTVFVRDNCHLCASVLAVVAAVCAELGESYLTHDVDSDANWQRQYTDLVPVTLVDDRQLAVFHLSPEALRAALQAS